MNVRAVMGFALGPVAAALFGFITLPVVTWFYPAEDIGRLAMLQVAVNLSLLVFCLGLDQAYVREYHGHRNREALFKTAIAPGLLLLGLVTVVVLLNTAFLSRILFDSTNSALAGMVLICVLSAFALRFLSLVLRMEERGLAFSVGQFLPKLFFLVLIGVYAVSGWGHNIQALLLAHTLSLFSVAFLFLVLRWKVFADAIKQKVDLAELGAMLRYGFPLIFAGLAFWGLTASDKILLRALSNLEQLGVYSVAVSFAGAALVLKMVFQTLWAPQVYKWEREGEASKRIQAMNDYMLVVVSMLFCLIGSVSWSLDYLLPAGYEQVKLILVSCLGYPLLLVLSETTAIGISLARKTRYSLAAALVAFVANVGLNLLLIPAYEAAGAAVATIVSFWLFFILRAECACRIWQPFPRLEQYFTITVLTVLAVFTTLFGDRIGWLTHVFWAGLFVVLFAFYAKRVSALLALLARKMGRA